MTDAPVVGDRDLSADAIVGRIFEATVAAFDLLSVVIGTGWVSTARSLATECDIERAGGPSRDRRAVRT